MTTNKLNVATSTTGITTCTEIVYRGKTEHIVMGSTSPQSAYHPLMMMRLHWAKVIYKKSKMMSRGERSLVIHKWYLK